MIVIQDDTLDSCVCNILLQNLGTEYKKTVSTHFVISSEFSILSKQIAKWYFEPEEKHFVWIINQDLKIDTLMTLGIIVNENPQCKFIYVKYDVDSKQIHMLDELSKHSNFKYLMYDDAKSNSYMIYKFMSEKNYELHNTKNILRDTYSFEHYGNRYEYGYKMNVLYEELGFYHFKEQFLYGNFSNGLLNRADSIIERRKKIIENNFKKGVIQQDDGIVFAVSETDLFNDLIYFTNQKKIIINLINSTELKIFYKKENLKEFFDIIKIREFFKAEISSVQGELNVGTINIKPEIKFEAAVGILQYLYSELRPF